MAREPMSELRDAPRVLGPEAREAESARDAANRRVLWIWLWPFLVLTAAAIVLLVAGHVFDQGRGFIRALQNPDPHVAASVLGNVGQVVAQVLGVAISVVAIIVELAANRYTHRITELFFRARVNFVVMGLFVVSVLQTMWASFTFTDTYAPKGATALAMALMTVSVLLLLPYFAFVASFVNPLNIIRRIRRETLRAVENGPRSDLPTDVENVQHTAEDGAEQLSDVSLNAMANHDKGIAMAAVNAVGDLVKDYLDVKSELNKSWFTMGAEVRGNPDFVSLADEALGEIEKDRTWFEFKLLRQYETIYRAALNNARELNYLIAINTREVAEGAMERGDKRVIDLTIKFFNTYLRATVNARDVRTAYNVLNQYRVLAEAALRRGEGRVAIAIAKYFKYYGQLAFHMDLGFILETAAYDLCSLNELAFDLGAKERPELLRVFLQVDKEGEGAKKEAALRGVRKAQVKLAAYYLYRGDADAARLVYRDMENEQPSRLASIRDELLAVDSPYFWEVTDRGTNFDWMATERREKVVEFFEWFGDQLPTPRWSVVPSSATAAPLPVRATATTKESVLSDTDAAQLVSDPGAVSRVSAPPAGADHTPTPHRAETGNPLDRASSPPEIDAARPSAPGETVSPAGVADPSREPKR